MAQSRDVFGRFSKDFAGGIASEIIALREATQQSIHVKRALDDVGRTVVEEVQAMMRAAGPPPSAPYSPPAIRSGALHDSYRHVVEPGDDGFTLAVGSDLEYSKYLEFGTVNMAPRPHLAPGVEVGVREARRRIGEGIVAAEREAIARMPRTIEL